MCGSQTNVCVSVQSIEPTESEIMCRKSYDEVQSREYTFRRGAFPDYTCNYTFGRMTRAGE
jgi:hypothetical protein